MIQTFNIIADGDSWFDYPKFLMTGGGLITHLEEVSGLEITNFAHAGDSTLEALGLTKSQRLERLLVGADVLLFSGGGDDIAGDQFCLWLNQNDGGDDTSKAVCWPRLNAVLKLIIANYEDLFALRDRIAPNCLIITHDYDYPVAARMGVGVLGFIGPWLKPSLDYCGWHDVEQQVEIVQIVLRAFASEMMIFSRGNRLHLHVHTQGTLGPDDWDNEIHANAAGWTKLAQVVNAALLPHLMAAAVPSPGSCGPESAD